MVVDGDGVDGEPRPVWLVVTADARLLGVERLAPAGSRIRIVADLEHIAELLRRERPRLAIVEGPAEGDGAVWNGALTARLGALVHDGTSLVDGGANALDASIDGVILPVGNGFELDIAAHELRHAGGPVHLRPREFQLLAALAADPGRVFTRARLIELVWSSNRDVDRRTVDVHVHALRAKIEPRPQAPAHLVTIRGFGYRLDPVPR